MNASKPSPDRLEAAEAALRWVFPDLQFQPGQITPAAAVDAFRVLKKVDRGSRIARGLFELVQLPLNARSWSDIPEAVWDAAKEALKEPGHSMKSKVAVALIALQHERLMQWHLRDPENHPCPDFASYSLF